VDDRPPFVPQRQKVSGYFVIYRLVAFPSVHPELSLNIILPEPNASWVGILSLVGGRRLLAHTLIYATLLAIALIAYR
jgi:hypothetical protein